MSKEIMSKEAIEEIIFDAAISKAFESRQLLKPSIEYYLSGKEPNGMFREALLRLMRWTEKKAIEAAQELFRWTPVESKPPEDGIEVIGYSEKWIHPDFNPEGTRVCFINEGDWHSAKWNNDQDSWHTHAEWCCKESGGTDFAPTHWTRKPQPPKQ